MKEFKNVALLTEAEYRVFCRLGRGSKTRQIALAVKRSLKTIEAHIAAIKKKLSLNSLEAVRRLAALYVEGLKNKRFARVPVPTGPRAELVAL